MNRLINGEFDIDISSSIFRTVASALLALQLEIHLFPFFYKIVRKANIEFMLVLIESLFV